MGTGEGLNNLIRKVDRLVYQASLFSKPVSPLKKIVPKKSSLKAIPRFYSQTNNTTSSSSPVSSTPKKTVKYKLRDNSISIIQEDYPKSPKFKNRFKKLKEINPTYLRINVSDKKIEPIVQICSNNNNSVSYDSGYSRSSDSSVRNSSGESEKFCKFVSLVDRLQN